MDGAELTPTPTSPETNTVHHIARPTLGFPLGTALLLLIIFCLSGVFSCCYHWDKLRSLRRRRHLHPTQQLPVASTATAAHQHLQFDSPVPLSPSKPTFQPQDLKKESQQSLPVIMAGDRYPKFMAWPCPCQSTSNASVASGGGGGGGDVGGVTVITVGVLLVPSFPLHSSSPPSIQHSVN